MKRLTERIIGVIEERYPEFTFSDEGDYWDIYVDNSAGEDFHIEITKDEDEVRQLISYCDGFDVEEHVKMWIGGPGAPDVLTLVDNTRDIAESLNNLSRFLTYEDF